MDHAVVAFLRMIFLFRPELSVAIMIRLASSHSLFCAIAMALLGACSPAHGQISVSPATIELDGPESTVQVAVWQPLAAGRSLDLTRSVRYQVIEGKAVVIDANGLVQPREDGVSTLEISRGGETKRVPVVVKGVGHPQPVSFASQVIPILTKAGCNSGGCHGKAEGQNGFKLTVFGYDAPADHQAIVVEGRGRRIRPGAPDASLLLLKGTAAVPHGGGRKIAEGSHQYKLLARWLAEGARFDGAVAGESVRLEVEPATVRMAPGDSRQLRVVSVGADGRRRCVTTEAEYDTNAPNVAGADRKGLLRAGDVPGEAAVLVRYMNQVAVCRVTLPGSQGGFVRPPEVNFIDTLAWNKLSSLGLAPAGLADDGTYMRRVYLDTIGTLPTAEEARAFLADKDPNKRARLADALFRRPEYADYRALLWSDLLRVDRDTLKAQGSVAMARWLRHAFATNMPYDRFARAIITARGGVSGDSPASFYRVLENPESMTRSVSQLFLGVRIECAQCHHHPSERWGQDDYFALAGFFTGVTRKVLPDGSEAIVAGPAVDLKNPRTKVQIPARPLGAAPVAADLSDRREALADWMLDPANPYFARAAVNRIWAHHFGHGLIEPIDDIRATNPAVNEELLDALAKHLRDVKYDLVAFTKTILVSRLYQLAPAADAGDERNFSRSMPRTLPAEVLLDAVCQVTGVPEKFSGWPEGARAIQLWDNRMPSYFLQVFGRPVRATVCACERGADPSISQALHLMNAPEIQAKIRARKGVAERLASSSLSPEAVVDELYLSCLARFPAARERAAMLRLFGEGNEARLGATEDALWAIINTREFVYNH